MGKNLKITYLNIYFEHMHVNLCSIFVKDINKILLTVENNFNSIIVNYIQYLGIYFCNKILNVS